MNSGQAAVNCLAIAGPTASGKTAAALAIAERWPVEIISVDSALVYQGMDIGTAKPSAAELAAVPHHLIDIRDPLHAYSAAEFVADAVRLIADINARGRTALLVGGTMLYFKALMQGLDDMPRANAAVREAIAARAQALGWPALHAELQHIDPITADRLFPNDAQRIARAIEVHTLTGQPLSSLQTGSAAHANPIAEGALLSLEPTDRAWLHQRIAERFDIMLAQGLVDEVRALRARGDLHADLPAMRCVGYRQIWALLDATGDAAPTSAQLAELRDRSIFATRQLAKRQLTWLRAMPDRVVVLCDAPDARKQVLCWANTRLSQLNQLREKT
jgi:tRNA dimethylallyltransferase